VIVQLKVSPSGGVCPQKHLCKFASASPARTFVEALPAWSRRDEIRSS